MVNEKTSIVKLQFGDNKLSLMGDTPDAGASQDEIDIVKRARNYKTTSHPKSCDIITYKYVRTFIRSTTI